MTHGSSNNTWRSIGRDLEAKGVRLSLLVVRLSLLVAPALLDRAQTRLSEVLLAYAGEHGHWRLREGPSTRPRLIYSSGLVGSFGGHEGGAG